MASSRTRRLAALLLLVAGLVAIDLRASEAQAPFAWWRSDEFRKELGLSADQIGRINKIYETTRPELRQEMDELNRYDEKLQKLLETSTDEALIARQIDRVETARANLNKTRALMIARMRLVLTPEQRVRLKELYERRESQSRPGPSSPDQRNERRPPDADRPQGPAPRNRPGC